MGSLKLSEALKILRRELVTKDEPLKAYKLLKHFDLPELKEELHKSYMMVRHYYDPEEYRKAYQDIKCDDCEIIEPEGVALNAQLRYWRYEWILGEMVKEGAESMMDLGCYVGSVVLTAANRGIRGCGVDFTPRVIEVAKKRASKFGLEEKTSFYVGDVTTFDKEKADVVSSFEVLEHVVDPGAYLVHIANLANKWGYVSTPNGPFGNGEGNKAQGWEWDGKGVRGHLRVFTKNSLTDLLKINNLDIGEVFPGNDGLLHAKFRRKV